MTKKEAMRQTHQQDTLMALGFTRDEAEALRRIGMTLHRWHEMECGNEFGCIEREEGTDKPFWRTTSGRAHAIPDREKGALKRPSKIMLDRTNRLLADSVEKMNAHGGLLASYIQTDPRGAALYILRPGDVPAGGSADAYYSRGICVY